MKKNKIVGLTLNGSLKKAGVTFFSRNGQTIMRVARSQQPMRRTREQFVARQRMRHAVAMWRPLKWAGEPLLGYGRFLSLMRRVPAVFLTENQHISGVTLLLPGMPVSDGVLPVVEQWLGEVEGTPEPEPSEVDALRWVDAETLAQEIAAQPQRFASWALTVLPMALASLC